MTDSTRPQRAPPVITRLLCLGVALAIVYLSLYPLEGWRLRQPSAFAFLGYGLPRYWTRADFLSNIAAYLVLGVLFHLSWFRAARMPWPILITTAAGVGLSLALECLQSYLPQRVPSLLDVLSNGIGALAGAVIGAATARARTRQGPPIVSATARWYRQGPALGWVLLVVWLVGQLTPQRVLFSTGSLLTVLERRFPTLGDWIERRAFGPGPTLATGPVDTANSAFGGATAAPLAVTGVVETFAVLLTVALVGILVMDLIRTVAGRITWILGALLLALMLRAIAAPSASPIGSLSVWLTASAQAALVLSVGGLYLLGAFGRLARLRIGLLLVPPALLLTWMASADPYYLASPEAGRAVLDPAMTPSLRSLIRWLGHVWPLLLAIYCLTRLRLSARAPRPASL
jgi:VanZ family protein